MNTVIKSKLCSWIYFYETTCSSCSVACLTLLKLAFSPFFFTNSKFEYKVVVNALMLMSCHKIPLLYVNQNVRERWVDSGHEMKFPVKQSWWCFHISFLRFHSTLWTLLAVSQWPTQAAHGAQQGLLWVELTSTFCDLLLWTRWQC